MTYGTEAHPLTHRDPAAAIRPHVGIFWWYQGAPIIASVPVVEGEMWGSFINGPYDHLPYWRIVQAHYPGLRPFEYEDIPRGRVLYSMHDHRFHVYLDKVLCKTSIKRILINAFHLPRSHTDVQTDLESAKFRGELLSKATRSVMLGA